MIHEELTPLQVSAQVCGEHPHPTPCSSPVGWNPALSKNTEEHKAKKAPTANPASREKKYPSRSLKSPMAVLVGAQSLAVLIPDEENMLTPCGSWHGTLRMLSASSFCCKILCRRNSSNAVFFYLTPKESCRVLQNQVHVYELLLSHVGDKPESFGHQARGREQGQRNEWE